jgi:hypothetical protein
MKINAVKTGDLIDYEKRFIMIVNSIPRGKRKA